MNAAHFQGLYDGHRIDPVIVCHIERPLADALGARVTRVFLSADTLEKQATRHPDLCADDYRALRPAIVYGECRQDGPRSGVILFVDRHLIGFGVRVYLKVTENGREIYANSFCKLNQRKYARELRKPLPILRAHRHI